LQNFLLTPVSAMRVDIGLLMMFRTFAPPPSTDKTRLSSSRSMQNCNCKPKNRLTSSDFDVAFLFSWRLTDHKSTRRSPNTLFHLYDPPSHNDEDCLHSTTAAGPTPALRMGATDDAKGTPRGRASDAHPRSHQDSTRWRFAFGTRRLHDGRDAFASPN